MIWCDSTKRYTRGCRSDNTMMMHSTIASAEKNFTHTRRESARTYFYRLEVCGYRWINLSIFIYEEKLSLKETKARMKFGEIVKRVLSSQSNRVFTCLYYCGILSNRIKLWMIMRFNLEKISSWSRSLSKYLHRKKAIKYYKKWASKLLQQRPFCSRST